MDLPVLTPIVGLIPPLPLTTFLPPPVLLYLGPETIMPITSVLAAAVGVLLIFWRHVTTTLRLGFRKLFVRKQVYSDSESNLNSSD